MKNKDALLKEIQEVSFALTDMTLYLDTHPEDEEALKQFFQFQSRRKEAMESFAKDHYPLTVDCMQEDAGKWAWGDAPPPWEGEYNVEL